MLSKKYYNMIAKILRESKIPYPQKKDIVERFIFQFVEDNPNFYPDTFYNDAMRGSDIEWNRLARERVEEREKLNTAWES